MDHLEEIVRRFGAKLERASPAPAPGREARPLPASPRELAAFLDHTLLRPDATEAEVEVLCAEALAHGFATVCTNGAMVPLASRLLAGSAVRPIAVVGFPLGAGSTRARAFEAADAVEQGALEIDLVIRIGALKAGDDDVVREDIAAVVVAAGPAPVKVILETALLTDEEKVRGALLARQAGAAFVKTSTGFGGGGATTADVQLLRRTVGDTMGVKASGGIRTADDALRMIRAGADRIGASASVAIVTGSFSTA